MKKKLVGAIVLVCGIVWATIFGPFSISLAGSPFITFLATDDAEIECQGANRIAGTVSYNVPLPGALSHRCP